MKYISLFFLFGVLVVSTILSGCGAVASEPIIPLKADEMQADLNPGGSFDATNTTANAGSGSYHVHASMANDSVVIDLNFTQQSILPYTVHTDSISTDLNYINYCITQSSGCKNYHSTLNSGSITISSVSPTVQGTFSGTLTLTNGGSKVTISNGAFNAVIQ
jgi:hypothetical protein